MTSCSPPGSPARQWTSTQVVFPALPNNGIGDPADQVLGHQEVTHEIEATEGNDTMSLSPINIAPIEHFLRAMTAAGATDLMLTAHTQPRMRVDGRLEPDRGQPVLTPAELEAGHRRAAAAGAAHRAAREEGSRLLVRATTSTHRFRGNCFFQQGIVALSLRVHPARDPVVRGAAAPAVGLRALLQPAAGPRARHRPDRLRQVDDARVDDRLHQRAPRSATSSRSRTRSSTCTSTRSAS